MPTALQGGDRSVDYAALLQQSGSLGPVPSQSDPSSRPTAGLVASDNLGRTYDDFRGLGEHAFLLLSLHVLLS